MKTYLLEGTMTALSSVSHIGETHGITALLRREKIAQPDGSVTEVPVISGNSIRGILRDVGMMHMLNALGYGVNTETGEVQGLSLAAFYFLLSGGALTKSSRGLDVDEARRWREMIPLVAVFGGAMGNQIMPGKLKVGKLIPICAETAHIVPARFVPENVGMPGVYEYCQQEAYTRRDDEKDDNKRRLLAPPEQTLLLEQAVFGESAPPRKKALEDTGQKQQMRYFVETLCAGTRFFWSISLDDAKDIEFEAFLTCLAEWGKQPYIGGKSAVGHGRMMLNFDRWINIDPRQTPTGTELAAPIGAAYMEHLKENACVIREMLTDVQ